MSEDLWGEQILGHFLSLVPYVGLVPDATQHISVRDGKQIFFFFFALKRAALVGHMGCIWFPGYWSSPGFSRWPTPPPQQHGIQASSETYTTAHGNAERGQGSNMHPHGY